MATFAAGDHRRVKGNGRTNKGTGPNSGGATLSPTLPTDLDTPPRRTGTSPEDWLIGGGEMGRLIRSMDWTHTPLGPIASWPQSLRTTVSLCLASNFPISLTWGPQHIQIYNDGYWPLCGGKHPQSLGQDFSECWASAWPVIGEVFTRALAGQTTYLENQRMFLDRNGYLEETFFTFSFSPIRDETGGVGGLFHPVTETTGPMLSARRTRALRDLAARAGTAQTIEEAFTLAARTLAEAELDLPFTLFYLLDDQGQQARLLAHTGLRPGTPASPAEVDCQAPQPPAWPWEAVVHTNQVQIVDDLETRFGHLACGPYPEPPRAALVLPITLPGHDRPTGILITGVSSRLPLDEAYRAFYDLLAAGVTSAAANARAYAEERQRAQALADIDRAKTAFFSNVSHEFRTPLTLMLGPLEDELAECAAPLPPARRARLETAHRNSLRLLKLVNTLLDFSRIEAGRLQASYEPTDLAEYTVELAGVFRSAVEKAGLTLTVDCPPLPEPVYIDREMWEKVVLNLLSNAFKHTFEGGIQVRLRWCGDHAELAVTDSGVGIAAAELPRLFERFYRLKGARSRTHEGTGIGLALVQELVLLHGGRIDAQSQEGQGSTFTITVPAGHSHLPPERVRAGRSLPAASIGSAAYVEEALHWLPDAAAPAKSLETGDRAPFPNPGAAHSGPRPRILWADDNADLRSYVTGLLAPYYHVEAVTDGAMALEVAHERPPDLILSDVMMPRLNGPGLLAALRSDPRTQTIPVILLSARAGEEAAIEGLDAGADDYLAKPFSARELLARVRTHLELARMRRTWAAELEAVNKELEAFSYSVSHDLRAPLRSIDGFSQILLEDYASTLDPQAQHYLQRVRAGSQRMAQLIDDLLNLSRVTRSPLHRQTVDLSALVQEIATDLHRTQPERSVQLSIVEGVSVQADARLLRIVLENLLQNAWKFTGKREQAIIAFGTLEHEGRPAYYVRDNGAGFDMAYAKRLFGAFQRLHNGSEFPGTGIGLATVQRIIGRHGGRVWADGKVDQGATFYFSL